MKIDLGKFVVTLLFIFTTSTVFANTNGFVSLPASAFSEVSSSTFGARGSYKGNGSGTSRSFVGGLFAAINLPHGATVTSLSCGSKSAKKWGTKFILRRNEPQQANVDMATIETTRSGAYQFLNTASITSPKINNSKYNYYIVAKAIGSSPSNEEDEGLWCEKNCANVNFCNVGYTIIEKGPGLPTVKFR